MTEFDENFEEETDVPRFDDTNDTQEESSNENLFGATWSFEPIDEDIDLEIQYQDADNKYKAVKNDIEMSRTQEEQIYWTNRADEIWHQRDELGGKIEQEKHNK